MEIHKCVNIMMQAKCEKHVFVKVNYACGIGIPIFSENLCKNCGLKVPDGLYLNEKYKYGIEYPQIEDYPNMETYSDAIKKYKSFILKIEAT